MRSFLFLALFTMCVLLYSNPYIEFNQMLGINIGYQTDINKDMGFRLSLGACPLNIKTISYTTLYYYYLPENIDGFRYSLEAGLLLGYFDLLENRYVDWSEHIDSPFAGWLTGVGLRGEFGNKFTLRVGLTYWAEWQEDSGFKNGIIPIITAGWIF